MCILSYNWNPPCQNPGSAAATPLSLSLSLSLSPLLFSPAQKTPCIDELPRDKAALKSLLISPPPNKVAVGLRFGEQRLLWGAPFTCNGAITKITFAAASSSGTDLPELGIWNRTNNMQYRYHKTASQLLMPNVSETVTVMVEGKQEMVEIHEQALKTPLPFSPDNLPGVFFPNDVYRLQLYLFKVTNATDDIFNQLSYFQRRNKTVILSRVVFINGQNLLPFMALQICESLNTIYLSTYI